MLWYSKYSNFVASFSGRITKSSGVQSGLQQNGKAFCRLRKLVTSESIAFDG